MGRIIIPKYQVIQFQTVKIKRIKLIKYEPCGSSTFGLDLNTLEISKSKFNFNSVVKVSKFEIIYSTSVINTDATLQHCNEIRSYLSLVFIIPP